MSHLEQLGRTYVSDTKNMNAIREALLGGQLTQVGLMKKIGKSYNSFRKAMDGLLSNGEVVKSGNFYELTDKGRIAQARKTLKIKDLVPEGRMYFQPHEINQAIRKALPGFPVQTILRTIRENKILATPLNSNRKVYSLAQLERIFELVKQA